MRLGRLSYLGRWWVIVTLAIVIALTASAFSGSLLGTVQGRLLYVGGPSPPGHAPIDPGIVWFTGPKSTWVHVGNGGRFQVSLPAGSYTVTGGPFIRNLPQNRYHACPTKDGQGNLTGPTVLHPGATETVQVVCDIR
jgi:hypothetical protein